MATVDNRYRHQEQVDLPSRPVWSQSFDADDRERQLEDDLFASRSVTGVLMTVIAAGVLLMAMTVWICLSAPG